MVVVTSSFSKNSVIATDVGVDRRPNRRNKAAFSHFSGVIWMGLESSIFEEDANKNGTLGRNAHRTNGVREYSTIKV